MYDFDLDGDDARSSSEAGSSSSSEGSPVRTLTSDRRTLTSHPPMSVLDRAQKHLTKKPKERVQLTAKSSDVDDIMAALSSDEESDHQLDLGDIHLPGHATSPPAQSPQGLTATTKGKLYSSQRGVVKSIGDLDDTSFDFHTLETEVRVLNDDEDPLTCFHSSVDDYDSETTRCNNNDDADFDEDDDDDESVDLDDNYELVEAPADDVVAEDDEVAADDEATPSTAEDDGPNVTASLLRTGGSTKENILPFSDLYRAAQQGEDAVEQEDTIPSSSFMKNDGKETILPFRELYRAAQGDADAVEKESATEESGEDDLFHSDEEEEQQIMPAIQAEAKSPASKTKEAKHSEAKKQRAAREAARRERPTVVQRKDATTQMTRETRYYVEFQIRLNGVALAGLDASTRNAYVSGIAKALGVSLKSVVLRGARESVHNDGSVLETRVAVRDAEVARALGSAVARGPPLFPKADPRFAEADYVGSVEICDGETVVYQFENRFASGDDVVRIKAVQDDDVPNDGFLRTREVGTQCSGNHASVQADLKVPGLDGTAAFLPPPPPPLRPPVTYVPPTEFLFHSVGCDPIDRTTIDSDPNDDDAPDPTTDVPDPVITAREEDEPIPQQQQPPPPPQETPYDFMPPPWMPPPFGGMPYMMPWMMYPPMMPYDEVHARKTQLELLAESHARIAHTTTDTDVPKTSAPRLTQMVAAQAAYRKHLTTIRQRIMQQRFHADLVARGVTGATYPSLATTREYVETHRPAPLPYWKAFMHVDGSLSEAEARGLAANYVAASK